MKKAVLILTIIDWLILGFLLYFAGSIIVTVANNNDGWATLALAVVSLYSFFGMIILCIPMVILVKKLTLKETKIYFYSTLGNVLLTVIMFSIALLFS